jgi:hypothetical protein
MRDFSQTESAKNPKLGDFGMDQRTLSSLIERLLTEYCQKVGTPRGGK